MDNSPPLIPITAETFGKTGRRNLSHYPEEELNIITGLVDRDASLDLLHGLGAKTVAVTLGKEGTLISSGASRSLIGSIAVKSIDSTGAGDAFVGAMLYQISQLSQPKAFTSNAKQQQEFVTLANQVGAIVCTKV
ncbi:PfkB family carbohydrate kinase [Paenibacillus sp. BJ-4]|uniref:PfkB family carbohydrate kinase n=1 Tax=Paenibacillus sp. BJ-4 TaxID=2878097 RepID=UPI001CF0685A|nr:PfkB family carbohydrate kinase [Paenibacillus sp. BJ-4]